MKRSHARHASVLCVAVALVACHGTDQAQQATPPPLAPRDLRADQQHAKEAQQIYDDRGNLLPSTTLVAGIVLPRGMQPEYTFEHEFYFRSNATLAQLQTYFGPRLLTGQVDRAGRGVVTYVNAQPKDTTKKAYVSVRIGPAPGNAKQSQVLIRETPMMPVKRPSEAESRKQLETALKYAD